MQPAVDHLVNVSFREEGEWPFVAHLRPLLLACARSHGHNGLADCPGALGTRRRNRESMLMTDRIALDRRLLLLTGLAASSSVIATAGAAEAAPSEAGLTVIAEIVAKPERAAEVRSALAPFATRTKSEPGCLHYALYEDAEVPGHFFTIERWTDEAALTAHLTSPALKAAGPMFEPLMAAPLAVHRLRSVVA